MENPGRSSWKTENRFPLIAVIVTAALCIVISIICLASGIFIIFQNLFYVPIILACFYFTRRGFFFSILLSIVYFLLVFLFSREPVILFEALVRVASFILVAGIVTVLALIREQTTLALEESDRRYTSLFNNNYSVSLLIDPDTGKIVDANDAAVRYYGFSREDLLARGIYDLNRLERERVVQNLIRAKDEHQKHFFSTHYLASGEKRNVEIFSGPITIQGRPLFYSIIHDITDRKRAERALKESQELLNITGEIARVGGWELDAGSREVHWTAPMYRLFEVDDSFRPSLAGILEFFLPEDREIIMIAVDRALADGSGFDLELVVVTAKGSRLWTRSVCRPQAMDGRVTRLTGTFQDITDRKAAEAAIREHEEEYRRIVETAGEGIWVMDQSFVTTFVNRQMAEMLGYSPEDMVGMPMKAFLDVSQLDDHEQHVINRRAGISEKYERIFQHRDGTPRWTLVAATPLHDRSGGFSGSFAMITDVTEKRRAINDLSESEERFRVIFHNQLTGLLMIDPATHTITDVNATALSMMGASREEVIGRVCHTFICPAERGSCPVTDRGQIVDSSERILLKKTGEKVPVLKSVNNVSIRGQKYLIESFIDISDRKRAEEELRAAALWWQKTFDAIADPLFILDTKGVITRINRAAEDTLGLPAKEIIGRRCCEVVHGTPDNIEDCPFIRMIGSGHREGFAVQYKGIWYNVTADPVYDDKGNLSGAIHVMTDIDTLKRFARARSRLAAIIDSSEDAIISVATDGSIVSWNSAAARMFGYPADEIVGRNYTYLLTEKMKPAWESAFSQVLHGGVIRQEMVDLTGKDGHLIEASLSGAPVFDDKGTLSGVAVIIRDMTDQRKAERDMLAYISEAAMRLQKPVGLIRENLDDLTSMVKAGTLTPEEISLFVAVQARNADQVLENLKTLNKAIVEGHDEIPKAYREFLSS